MITSAMKRMMSISVNVMRRPPVNSTTGKQGAPVLVLTGLKTTPIDPLNIDEFHNIKERYNIKGPEVLRSCYCQTNEIIRSGDVIVYNSIEYTVRGVGPWGGDPEATYEIVLVDHVDS